MHSDVLFTCASLLRSNATSAQAYAKHKTIYYAWSTPARAVMCMHTFGSEEAWVRDMEALDYKEEAQHLQALGLYDAALVRMLHSVHLRERSHTLCLSLSELAELYLYMLMHKEAEDAARRMLAEAHRYDTDRQQAIAMAILTDVQKQAKLGLQYGLQVQLNGLKSKTELNGLRGTLLGISPDRTRYLVGIDGRTLAVRRNNMHIEATPDGEKGT